MINTVTLCGRVGLKKEIFYFESGKCNMKFTVAVKGYNDKTTWVDCTAWNKTAEFLNQYVKVGAFVVVHGRLEKDEWQDPDGMKKSRLYVVADQVESPKMNGDSNKEEDDFVDKAVPF